MQLVVYLQAITCKHKNALKTKILYENFSIILLLLLLQNSEYEEHQIGPKYSRSQHFSFPAFKGEAVSMAQKSSYNGA
jgi:hypothetical protein